MKPVAPTPPSKKKPRRWRLVLVIIGLLLVLAVGAYIVNHLLNRWATEKELQQVIAELDQIDPRWRFEDMEADRKSPAEGRNSADLVLKVQSLLPKDFPSKSWKLRPTDPDTVGTVSLSDKYDAWPRQIRFDAAMQAGLHQELTACDQALTQARRLADLPEGRFRIAWRVDYLNTLIEEVQLIRAVVFLLTIDASFRTEKGDLDGTMVSLRAAVNAARSLGDEPSLMAALVRMATVQVALQGAERLLAQGEPAEASLAELQQLLEREERESLPDFVNSMRAERALTHRMLEALESGRITIEEAMTEKKKINPSALDWANSVLIVPMVRHSDAVYLRLMTDQIEATAAPLPEWGERIQALKAMPIDKSAVFARLLFPHTWKVMEAEQRTQAVLRCAITGMAVERYRQAKGRWPKTLAELVPDFLLAVPEDPYDGQPLRLRRLEDGLVVYSVGPDGIDNEGKFDRKMPTREGTDLTFRLWDVKHRHQPPPEEPLPKP